jgi:hypothetical protein
MLHACVQRFDVTDDRGNILGWDEEVNKAYSHEHPSGRWQCRLYIHAKTIIYVVYITKNFELIRRSRIHHQGRINCAEYLIKIDSKLIHECSQEDPERPALHHTTS